jgi:hypothetical protein
MNTEQVDYNEFRSVRPFPKLKEETTYCFEITKADLNTAESTLKFFAGAVNAEGETTKYSAASWLTHPSADSLQGKEKANSRKRSFDGWYYFLRATGYNIPERARYIKAEKAFFINGNPVTTDEVSALDDTIAAAVFAALKEIFSADNADSLVGKRFYARVKASKDGKYRNILGYTVTGTEPTDVEVEYTNLAE